MTYHQITAEERSLLMAMRVHGASLAQIARALGRHRSTIIREIARNSTNHDGYYTRARGLVRAHASRALATQHALHPGADHRQHITRPAGRSPRVRIRRGSFLAPGIAPQPARPTTPFSPCRRFRHHLPALRPTEIPGSHNPGQNNDATAAAISLPHAGTTPAFGSPPPARTIIVIAPCRLPSIPA